MANFIFKKESSVYLVYQGLKYKLEVSPDLTFSQTFTEESSSVKTLHTQNFFERATIKKANPANFAFKIPVFKENDIEVVHDRLLDCNTFDLYISTTEEVFKLEKAVITNGTYEIEKSTPLSLSVSGEASELSRMGPPGSYTIPGTLQSITAGRTYLQSSEIEVSLNAVNISTEVYSLSVELQNEVSWNPNNTIHSSLNTTNATNIIYPLNFTVSKKILAGSVGRYITDSNDTFVQNFDESRSLVIKVGQRIGGTLYGFTFNMPTVSVTNRMTPSEVYTQNYDWRLTSNQALTTTITYNNI